jgi:hypothetical protein
MGQRLTDDELLEKLNGQSSGMSDDELLSKLNSEFSFGSASREERGRSDLQSAYPTMLESLGIGAKTNLKGYGHGAEQLGQTLTNVNPTLSMYAPDIAEDYQPFSGNREEYSRNLDERAMANRAEFQESKKINPWSTMGGSVLSDIALGAPLMGLGAVQAPAKGAGYLNAIKSGAGQGAKYAGLESAGMGGLQYAGDDESSYVNAALSGLLGGGIGGAIGGATAAFRPSNIAQGLKGNISDEQLLKNMQAAKGTETSLGRVTEDAFLRDLSENVLPYVPFSGAGKAQARTATEINDQAAKYLEDLSGGRSFENVDVAEDIQKQLQKSNKQIRSESGSNYKAITDLAKSLGIKVETNNLADTSTKILNKIQESPSLARKQDPGLMADLAFYAKGKQAKSEYSIEDFIAGKIPEAMPQAAPESLESLSLLRGELGEDAWEKLIAGKRHTSGHYTALNKAVEKDIDTAIAQSGNTELKTLGRDAKEFYKQNVVPLNDRGVKKFVDDPALTQSENIIATFIKYGPKQDRVKRMQQLTNHLDPATMDKLRFAIFSDAEGMANAQEMSKVLGKLGKKQKQELIPDANLLQQMEQLSLLAKMNPEAFNQMANPKTGFRNQMMEAAKTYGPAAAASFINPALGIGAVSLGKGLNKVLTSEKVREALVNSMLSGQKQQTGKSRLLNDAIVKMLTPAATVQKEESK